MKRIFTLFIITVLAVGARAQSAAITTSEKQAGVPTTTKEPDVLTLKETEYDFGKIPQGKPVIHIFEIANLGKDSLKIANVQASCGCTTPEWEKEKMQAPGESTKITVGFNAGNEGVFSKVITITYNSNLTKQITIKGEVWRTPATSAPENKELGNLKDL